MKIPKMPRNYYNFPNPKDYPLWETYDHGPFSVPVMLENENTTRQAKRKAESHMKFADKLAPQAVDAYLMLKEAQKKIRQKINRSKINLQFGKDLTKAISNRTTLQFGKDLTKATTNKTIKLPTFKFGADLEKALKKFTNKTK